VLEASAELELPVDKHPIDLHALDVLAMQTLVFQLFADCSDFQA
jgi:hypothetical protein